MVVIADMSGLCGSIRMFVRLAATVNVLHDKPASFVDRHDPQTVVLVGQAKRGSRFAGQRERDRRREHAEQIDDGQKPARPQSIRSGQAHEHQKPYSLLLTRGNSGTYSQTHSKPSRKICPKNKVPLAALTVCSAHCRHQFGNLLTLIGFVVGSDRAFDTMGDMILQQFFLDTPKCGPHRGYLCYDIDTIAILVHHFGEAAHLAFDTAKALPAGRLDVFSHAA